MKNIRYLFALIIAAVVIQSCEDERIVTYMSDYTAAREFTPDWTDPFDDLGAWESLEDDGVIWSTNEDGLLAKTVTKGRHHRMVRDMVSAEDFIVEFELKIISTTGLRPKACMMIGELGTQYPPFYLGLNYTGDENAVTYRIDSKPSDKATDISVPAALNFDVSKWQTIRLKKSGTSIYIYVAGERVYYEKGEYMNDITGKLGIYVEDCEASFRYIAYGEQ